MKKTSDDKKPENAQLSRSLANDARAPVDMTPIPVRGRDAVDMTPIPVAHQPAKIGDVGAGRDAVDMTPVPTNPLEKGRGGAPMVPVPAAPPAAPPANPGTNKKP